MAGVVPVFRFLDKASIYAFLDLAFDLVDLVLWGGVRTSFYHRFLELGFDFEVDLDQFLPKPGLGQRS